MVSQVQRLGDKLVTVALSAVLGDGMCLGASSRSKIVAFLWGRLIGSLLTYLIANKLTLNNIILLLPLSSLRKWDSIYVTTRIVLSHSTLIHLVFADSNLFL